MKKYLIYTLLALTVPFALRAQNPHTATGKDLNMTVVRWARTYYDYTHLMCCQFECQNGYNFDFYINLPQDSVTYNHTYTLSDMNTRSSYGQRGSAAIVYKTVQLTFFLDELEREVANFFVEDVSGNTYTAFARYKPLPEMIDTIPVVIKNSDFVDERDVAYHNYYTFQGRADSLEFVFCVKSQQLVGAIDEKEVYIGSYSPYTYGTIYHKNGTWTDIAVGRAVNGVVEQGVHEGDYICTVDLLCYDGHCYHVTFRHELPTPKDEQNLHFTNMIFNQEFYQQFGVYSYVGSTDDYRTEIILYSSATPGNTYLVPSEVGTVWLFDSRTQQDIPCFQYSSVTVSGTTTSPILQADFLSKDSVLYHITLEYIKPTLTREETLNVSGRFADMITDNGSFQALAYNADSSRIVSLMFKATTYAGHFTEADLDAKYTYVLRDYVENKPGSTAFKLVEADITTVWNATSKILTITGTMLCENGNQPSDIPLFTLNMTCALDEGLDYDCDNMDVDAKFTSEQMTVESQAGAFKTKVYNIIANNDHNQMVGLVFFAKVLFPFDALPAGVYTINHTMTGPSLLASEGIGEDGSVSFSFISTLTDEGGLAAPIWFFRDGTATVTYPNGQLHIEIVATNSYGRQIHIEMGAGVMRDLSNLKANEWTQTVTTDNTTLCTMMANDSSYLMQVEINAVELSDNQLYDTDDMNLSNCFALNLHSQEKVFFTQAQFRYHLDAHQQQTARLTALDADSITYGITCNMIIPIREETIIIEDAELFNYVQESGVFQLRGINETQDRQVSVAVITPQILGHFTERDMDTRYTYVIDNPEEEGIAVPHNLLKADIEVTLNEQDSMLYLEGSLICRNADDSSDVALYHVTMSTFVNIIDCLPYDAPNDNPYSHVFNSEIHWNLDYLDYNTIFMEAHDVKDGIDDFVYLGFVVPNKDDCTVVPEGTYPIDFSGNWMTVMASSGVSPTGGDVAASFVAQKNAQTDMIEPPLWFLQSGTVTVTKQDNNRMNILVEAVNSCGTSIHVEINATTTDHQTPEAKQEHNVRKVLRNGRICIEYKGQHYNMLGSKLSDY